MKVQMAICGIWNKAEVLAFLVSSNRLILRPQCFHECCWKILRIKYAVGVHVLTFISIYFWKKMLAVLAT